MADRWYVRATAAFRRPRTWAWIGAVIVAVAVAWRIQAVDGQVIDAATGKPLEGVFVVGQWDGWSAGIVEGRSACYHLNVIRTGTDGRFLMSSWSGNVWPFLQDRLMTMHYYKPGYGVQWSGDDARQVIALMPATRSVKERMDELSRLLGNSDCGSKSRMKVLVPPLFLTIAEEARTIAGSRAERIWASNLLYRAEHYELGEDLATRNAREREREEWKRPE